ncbi:SdpI family protein [Nesterenkonia aurantiaca]|uniref:SdpI family protein n=1 Tax=Nesterenkonia aurantiaca TaxID=1436010 RepID=UPI003EE691BD
MTALVFGIVLITAGVLTTLLAFACRRGTLPLNAFVGIRIPSTTADAETWVRAHRAAWRWIAIAGAGPVFSGTLLLFQGDESGLAVIAGTLWLLGFIIGASVVASAAAANDRPA